MAANKISFFVVLFSLFIINSKSYAQLHYCSSDANVGRARYICEVEDDFESFNLMTGDTTIRLGFVKISEHTKNCRSQCQSTCNGNPSARECKKSCISSCIASELSDETEMINQSISAYQNVCNNLFGTGKCQTIEAKQFCKDPYVSSIQRYFPVDNPYKFKRVKSAHRKISNAAKNKTEKIAEEIDQNSKEFIEESNTRLECPLLNEETSICNNIWNEQPNTYSIEELAALFALRTKNTDQDYVLRCENKSPEKKPEETAKVNFFCTLRNVGLDQPDPNCTAKRPFGFHGEIQEESGYIDGSECCLPPPKGGLYTAGVVHCYALSGTICN